MATDVERLASLEEKAIEGQRQREAIFDKLERQDGDLSAIRAEVSKISATLSRYQGFLGGVMFVLTAVGSVAGAVAMALWNKISGQH